MILLLGPVDGIFFPNLQSLKVYLLDKIKPWFGFGDLDPIFKVTGVFSLKMWLEPVNGFHLT